MLSCANVLATLGEYVDNSLGGDERLAFDSHLKQCSICRHLAHTYARTGALCHRAWRVQGGDEPLRRLLDRLRQDLKK